MLQQVSVHYLIMRFFQKFCLLWRVPHSVAQLLARCFAGDFTNAQLELAGLPIPETNEDHVGGQGINPGSDSDVDPDKLQCRAEEDADLLDRADPAAMDKKKEGDGFVIMETEEAEEVDNANCIMIKHTLDVIPGIDHEGATKDLYLCTLFLPSGCFTCHCEIKEGLDSLVWWWPEPG
jgi:hypothetical protein